jgi:conjugal transfer mating pair stabilization protein TraN
MSGLSDTGHLADAKGAYQLLKNPVLQGWTEVTQPFVTYLENITGVVKPLTQPVTQLAQETLSAFKGKIQTLTRQVLGHASATGPAGVPAGASQSMTEQLLGQPGAAMLSTVMTVYTAYVIAMTMVQILWPCQSEEFQLNAMKQLKNCAYVGSYCKTKVLGACVEKREAYCCFNSPLSRLIQEQVRPQLGLTWGEPSAPQCEGIPVERLAEVDWKKVNLDEWLGMLQKNGHYPDPKKLTPEALTGQGSALDIDATRPALIERTLRRLEGIEVDFLRNQATRQIKPETGAS